MDIARPELKRKKRIRRIVYGSVGLLIIVGLTVALSRLKPAAPSVDKATVMPGTVERGEMLVAVNGLGDLEPETIWTVSAQTDGRVIKRNMLAGTKVAAGTVILDMTSPKLEQQTVEDKSALDAAKATYTQTKATLENQLMTYRNAEAAADAAARQDEMDRENDEQLHRYGILDDVSLKKAQVTAAAAAKEEDIAKSQVETFQNSIPAQLAVQQAAIDKAAATYNLDLQQVADLHVRAGVDGVLQELESPAADIGSYDPAGTPLAKVVQPTQLKAVLKITETLAKDLQIGQKASIDTHNGIIPGHVQRIDPASINGTRTVDVHLDGPLPEGAVPDLSVEGTIEIERLPNVLWVGRPVHGDADSTIGLFKVVGANSWDEAREADRVQVQIGSVSVDKVEIKKGLNVGDIVILSDMSAQDNYDRIELR